MKHANNGDITEMTHECHRGVTESLQGCCRSATVQTRRFGGRKESRKEARETHEGQRECQKPENDKNGKNGSKFAHLYVMS
jgi:hypothetical protein